MSESLSPEMRAHTTAQIVDGYFINHAQELNAIGTLELVVGIIHDMAGLTNLDSLNTPEAANIRGTDTVCRRIIANMILENTLIPQTGTKITDDASDSPLRKTTERVLENMNEFVVIKNLTPKQKESFDSHLELFPDIKEKWDQLAKDGETNPGLGPIDHRSDGEDIDEAINKLIQAGGLPDDD